MVNRMKRLQGDLEGAQAAAQGWRRRALAAEDRAEKSTLRAAQLEGWVESLLGQLRSRDSGAVELTQTIMEGIRSVLIPAEVKETSFPPLEMGETGMYIPEWESDDSANPIRLVPFVEEVSPDEEEVDIENG